MHRRHLTAACATLAAVLALADPTPAQTQAPAGSEPAAAAQGAPATPPAAETQAAPTPPPAPPLDPLVAKARELAAQPRGKASGAERAAVAAYYAERTSLLWVTGDGFTPRAAHAMAEIAKADEWGLEARAFELPQLGEKSPEGLAEAEIKLSLAVLRYASHARGGRLDPSDISRNIDQKPSLRDPKAVLESVAATDAPGDYLRSLHPKHQQFELLRQALLKLRGGSARTEEKAEEEVRLPAGPLLKLGVEHPHVALLRKRLKVAAPADNENVYDADMQAAVEAFQRKSGSRPDGIVGSVTRAALNGDETGRPAYGSDEQRILINMERWRWMPEDMGNFHVWNNIPEFQTRLVREGQPIHQAKIIVGRPETPTVQFSANMRYVIFGPDWGVPDSIKVKEILPYLRPSDGGFFGFGGTDTRVLERHNLRVSYNGQPVDASQVDWSQVDIRKFTFIQPPGPGNVLGDVKFRFPNKHDIYMHDTPQRELFNHTVRTFSHGCMRVHNPGRFAEVILEEDKGWSAGHVRSLMSQGGNNNVTLAKTIPVHTTYFTVIVGSDGQPRSFGDIYGQDRRVAQALAGRPLPLEQPSIDSATTKDLANRDGRPGRRYQKQSSTDLFNALFGN